MLGICELLVARRLTKKVVLTRLPVGHTHEDIDAVFGIIWKSNSGLCILSPQQYKTALEWAMKKRNVTVTIEDVFCLPDYKKYMEPCIDPLLERYFVIFHSYCLPCGLIVCNVDTQN
jgi:hypothetical protein